MGGGEGGCGIGVVLRGRRCKGGEVCGGGGGASVGPGRVSVSNAIIKYKHERGCKL